MNIAQIVTNFVNAAMTDAMSALSISKASLIPMAVDFFSKNKDWLQTAGVGVLQGQLSLTDFKDQLANQINVYAEQGIALEQSAAAQLVNLIQNILNTFASQISTTQAVLAINPSAYAA